jgi:hypothetical protein
MRMRLLENGNALGGEGEALDRLIARQYVAHPGGQSQCPRLFAVIDENKYGAV